MYDYMKLFFENKEMGINHFANPTFRNNNNKLNSLKYTGGKWSWSYKSNGTTQTIYFDEWLNRNGLNKMEDTTIDENIEEISEEIAKMKYEMFYKINKTNGNKELLKDKEDIIEKEMEKMKNISREEYVNKFNKVENIFKEENSELYASHERYIYSCKKNFDMMLMEEVDDGYEYKKNS